MIIKVIIIITDICTYKSYTYKSKKKMLSKLQYKWSITQQQKCKFKKLGIYQMAVNYTSICLK